MPYRQIVPVMLALFAADMILVAAWKTGHGDPLFFTFPALERAWQASALTHAIADSIVVGLNVFIVVFLVARTLTRQARIAKELSVSEQKLKDFAASAAEWFWEMDADLRIVYLSEQCEKATGRSISSFIGRRRTDIAQEYPNDERWRRHLDDLNNRRPFRNFEYRINADDGRIVYLSVSGVPVFDETGAFTGYRGTGLVTTERKLAEEQARINLTLLRSVIDAVPAMISLKDENARYVLVNRYQAKAFGIPMEAMIGKTAEEILKIPEAGKFTANDRKVLATGEPYLNFEQPWIDPQGLSHFLIVNKVPLLDASGKPSHVVTVALDVTERRRMEESAMRLAGAMESISELFLICDNNDRIILANQRFRNINRSAPASADLGITFETHIRRIVGAGLVPDAIGREEEWIADRMERHRNPRGPFEVNRQEGRTLLINEYRLMDGGTATVSADITALKKAEAELRATKEEAELANRAKTEFLANMSHELRTPLNSIIGFTDILSHRRFGRDDPRYDNYLKDVNDAGRDLLNLINDIIDISRIERGQLSLSERNVDVSRLMTACYRLVLGRAHEMQIHFGLNLPKDFPALYADERRVKQALLNILSNAVKFTPPGGTVDFDVLLEETGAIVFTVKDTGVGIRPEDIAKVMTVFGQADGSLARRYEGSGLGLPLTRDLMTLHGGELHLGSSPGSGTTVTLRFPPDRTIRMN